MNREELVELLSLFQLESVEQFDFERFGSGLIHQTFFIKLGQKEYILQAFNSNVFKFPERIENNLSLLSNFGDLNQLPFQLPLPIPNLEGIGIVKYKGMHYRLFDFVGGQTLQQISDLNQAKNAAEAYANFSKWADSFPLEKFVETISNFHRLDLRFGRLVEVAKSAVNLTDEEQQVLDFYLGQKGLVENYLRTIDQIPLRLTHNDTKINNLIFSQDLTQVAAVVDLDTIMPGYLLYDFGDLVRTVASGAEEISLDWDSQKLITPVFEQLLVGYWAGAGDWMDSKEAKSLLIGGEVMTCIMGLRFLTDHLEGNVYYQVTYSLQNFHRAKNQMLLLKSLQDAKPELEKIWKSVTQA